MKALEDISKLSDSEMVDFLEANLDLKVIEDAYKCALGSKASMYVIKHGSLELIMASPFRSFILGFLSGYTVNKDMFRAFKGL